MSDHRVIFECVGGFFIPRLAVNPDGAPRDADGIRHFDAAQVSRITGLDLASVQAGADTYLAEVLSDSSPGATASRHALREKFSYLSDSHFIQLLERCRRLGLSPWGRQVWARTQRNDRTGEEELVVLLSADGFHAAAMRTREVEKIIGPHWSADGAAWSEVWMGPGEPFAARVGVQRRGMTEPVFMVAHWRDYAPFKLGPRGVKIYDDFWMKMPSFMLGKCASCLAIRRAFAEHLDGVYSPEEMRQASNPGPRELAEAVNDAAADESPQTPQQFKLALLDAGLRDPAQREAVIEEFKGRFRPLYAQNTVGFYRAVLGEVRRNPAAYGVAPVRQEA